MICSFFLFKWFACYTYRFVLDSFVSLNIAMSDWECPLSLKRTLWIMNDVEEFITPLGNQILFIGIIW